jgi:hypothetical protein
VSAIDARYIGEAAEVLTVVELRLAGFEVLVAACGDGEGAAGIRILRHGLP